MKIIYYVTDHGLGHSTRAVALIRELKLDGIEIVIRNNDRFSLFLRAFSDTKIIKGDTDFMTEMQKNNGMIIDNVKTRSNILKWLDNIGDLVKNEEHVIDKEKPDLLISDISIMPLLAARKANIPSAAISNFIWSETLEMDAKAHDIFVEAYSQADIMIRLPFGSSIKLPNAEEGGLVARKITQEKHAIRNQLGLPKDKKLVTLALGGIHGTRIQKSENIEILDLSDYSRAASLQNKVNLTEGQNIINASDLVLCKCGYGFISECLSSGTKFRYVLESSHIEANGIHMALEERGVRNKMTLRELENAYIDEEFIEASHSLRMETANHKIANRISRLVENS